MKRPQVVPALFLFFAICACAVSPTSLAGRNNRSHDYRVFLGTSSFAFVHVPDGHSTVGVLALHSLYHGYTEPIRQGWTALSDSKRFVAIYPERPAGSWNAGMCCGAAASTKRDDVTWLGNLVRLMQARFGLKTVYLTGCSNGGMMVERLVAERPGVAGKFAVWGAAPEMPRPGHWPGVGFIYHGVDDSTVPWKGGVTRINRSTYTNRSVLSTPRWLIGAQLTEIQVPGYGHEPEPNWPSVAWHAMTG